MDYKSKRSLMQASSFGIACVVAGHGTPSATSDPTAHRLSCCTTHGAAATAGRQHRPCIWTASATTGLSIADAQRAAVRG